MKIANKSVQSTAYTLRVPAVTDGRRSTIMKRIVLFTITCLMSLFLVILLVSFLADHFSENHPLYLFGGIIQCVALYLVAKFYPYKVFDDGGYLTGMHKVALGWGGFFVFGDVARSLGYKGMFHPPILWPDLIAICIPVICALVVYMLMVGSLSKKKKFVEQGEASDR